jgi:hypothetical protein
MYRQSNAARTSRALRLPNQVAPVIRSNDAGQLDNTKGVEPAFWGALAAALPYVIRGFETELTSRQVSGHLAPPTAEGSISWSTFYESRGM